MSNSPEPDAWKCERKTNLGIFATDLVEPKFWNKVRETEEIRDEEPMYSAETIREARDKIMEEIEQKPNHLIKHMTVRALLDKHLPEAEFQEKDADGERVMEDLSEFFEKRSFYNCKLCKFGLADKQSVISHIRSEHEDELAESPEGFRYICHDCRGERS